MPSAPPHPDRLCPTLAVRNLVATADAGLYQAPGPGSDDARIDLKLAAAATRQLLASHGTAAAAARLADLQSADLWAGTVQDGMARGFLTALEEARSLCRQQAPERVPEQPLAHVFAGKELRKKKDILLASAGARLRFSRKAGFHYIHRDSGLNVERCLSLEDRTDQGSLDSFEPGPDRPRLFDPAFLQPVRLEQGEHRDLLLLGGRLGRRPTGYRTVIEVEARKSETWLRLRIRVENLHVNHRLRLRFWRLPATEIRVADAATTLQEVRHAHGVFLATTLVRSIGRLWTGNESVPVPAAQCLGWIERQFELGPNHS